MKNIVLLFDYFYFNHEFTIAYSSLSNLLCYLFSKILSLIAFIIDFFYPSFSTNYFQFFIEFTNKLIFLLVCIIYISLLIFNTLKNCLIIIFFVTETNLFNLSLNIYVFNYLKYFIYYLSI